MGTRAKLTLAQINEDTKLTMKPQTRTNNEYSPVFIPNTQESQDCADVLWDWNSPVSDGKRNHKPKRLVSINKSESPRLKVKKAPELQQTSAFEKIKEELREFQNEINASSYLPTNANQCDKLNNTQRNNNCSEFSDFFDESFDEVLLMASQQIEEKIEKKQWDVKINRESPSRTVLKKSFSSDSICVSPISRPNHSTFSRRSFNTSCKMIPELPMNDSLDEAFEVFDVSMANVNNSPIIETGKSKIVSPATKLKSKSLSFDDRLETAKEIEMKRQAALMKLQVNKKRASPSTSDSDTSPMKCSPKEIEKKRQEALAKLQAKRKQEMIERNRKEALKRLELNKKKRGH